MPGSFDLSGTLPPLADAMMPIGVFRYNPNDLDNPLAFLPNIWCSQVDCREGPNPPTAGFRYLQDDALAATLGWPSRFEEIWPLDTQGNYVVSPDDRLLVFGQNPDGSPLIFFDGFAQVPQADVTESSEHVSFAAVSVAARCYDDVIHTRVQRDSNSPQDDSGDSDFEIQAPCRFNPAGDLAGGAESGFLKNSTLNLFYTKNEDIGDYPVFLDPLLLEREEADEESYLEYWTIADALRYLLARTDPGDDYVTWPTLASIGPLLRTIAPPIGSDTQDSSSPSSNCTIRDYDASNKSMPDVLADLLGYAGFLLTWQVGFDGDGNPKTYLKFYRRDAAATGTPKHLYLAEARSGPLNMAENNVAQLRLARDHNSIVNAWRTETAQKRVEVTVLLAPLFEPLAGDEQASSDPTSGRGQFKLANLINATAEIRRKYRWYGADECGDGHWNATSKEWSYEPLDLTPVFPIDDGGRTYSIRYRPGSQTLIAKDTYGNPLKAILEVYTDPMTSAADPAIQSIGDERTWFAIPFGWELLPDRLGIRLNVSDPEDWQTGNPRLPRIAGISRQSLAGASGYDPIMFRLTTVIESDLRIEASANKRVSSPTQFARWRNADARDHFQYCEVSPGSVNYPDLDGDGINPVVLRDDTNLAVTHAEQLRDSHEFPPLAGSVILPYITVYYAVGDRIEQIAGRSVSLGTNAATQSGEAPTFAWVVGVSWHFSGNRQQTILQLGDRRAEIRNSW